MTFIGEAIIGEFISKVSDSIVDISKAKIKEEVKNRKNKHQSLESQIYNIVVDVLNKITYDEYENDQDKIYDVAEKILKGFKSGIDNSEDNIKLGLNDICENVDENKCTEFKKLIYRELSKENYSELYSEISLLKGEKESNKTSRIERKVDETRYGVKEANEKLDIIVNYEYNTAIAQNKIVKKKSRTQEYADKWNANMFLNDFDKRDENAGVNVKLSEVYLDGHLPHYVWGDNEDTEEDLKELLYEYIEESNRNKMLLILGQPGIGKSTLITWITANFNERVDDILVYQFASDLKTIDWKKSNIHLEILNALNLSYGDLEGKTLILDGFDEVDIGTNRRKVLDNLYEGVLDRRNISDFSLIITCRENYIQEFDKVKCDYILLIPWNEIQIKSFCDIFQEKTKNDISKKTIENLIVGKEILGIPLILYMVLSLNISIEKEESIVDVYDKIFSLEGGIYDRCIDYKSFAKRHRIGDDKNSIHQISREIAMWMFENNPNEAYIPSKEYKEICSNIVLASANRLNEIKRQIHQILQKIEKWMSENSPSEVYIPLKEYKEICVKLELEIEPREEVREQDYIIGNFFKLKHCEGEKGEKLYFVHRSIYEYFFVEYFFCSIIKVIDSSRKDLESVFGEFLKGNILSSNMLDYLKIKILNSKLRDGFDIVNESFQILLQNGMTYHASKYYKESYKNVMDCEMNVFKNILEILHLWETRVIKFDGEIVKYLRYNIYGNLNLTKADLRGVCLREVDLRRVCLRGADLRGVDLEEANLKGTNLEGATVAEANMKGVDLEGANLVRVNLEGAHLAEANMKGVNLKEAHLRKANLSFANLDRANLSNADLRGSNLKKSSLIMTDLKRVNLQRANLIETNLEGANLEVANLIVANLQGANLEGVNLQGANLVGANLVRVNLEGANLVGANLNEVKLKGANLRGAIIDESCVQELKGNYNLKLTKIFNFFTNGTISYEEYCKRKVQHRWESSYNI